VFQKLVSHNNDIKRLVEKGYAIAFDSNYLIVRDIPYLDDQCLEQEGAIIAKLVFINENTVTQDDHQIFFAGGVPHNVNGIPIPNLGRRKSTLTLSSACNDIVVECRLSNKPKDAGKLRGFKDFFEKIESYVSIISGPAMNLHNANPYTYRAVESIKSESVFKFNDTLTSRAEITDLAEKFKEETIAIIGLGGTGSYVLDFLVKTPVREIRAFDSDHFCVHNSFRSPGRLQSEELGKTKAEIYQSRYDNFRERLKIESKYIDATNEIELDGVTFAFVCVDKGPSRAGIFDLLIKKGIPFIDVGMGIKRREGLLNGMLRATYYSREDSQKTLEKGLAELHDNPADLYKTNIQIGELNALNACLAVIKYKQLRGFYFEEQPIYHLLFEISDLKIVGESSDDED
jgi:hypothetical protein